MKTPIIPTTTMAAIGMMAWFCPLQQAVSQTDAATPTPDKGLGGAVPLDLDPKMAQVGTAENLGTVPRTDLTIPEIVAGARDFTTLAGALQAAGLEDELKKAGSLTLLAPDNNAFAALPESVLVALMKPENIEILKKILTYHVIPEKLTSTEIRPGTYVSVQGEPLTFVGLAEGKATIQGAGFGATDVMSKNGVIHVVKAVLIPPTVNIEEFKAAKTAE